MAHQFHISAQIWNTIWNDVLTNISHFTWYFFYRTLHENNIIPKNSCNHLNAKVFLVFFFRAFRGSLFCFLVTTGFLRPSYKKAAPFSALFSLKRICWWTGTVMTLSLGYTIREPTFCVCGSNNPFTRRVYSRTPFLMVSTFTLSDQHQNLPSFYFRFSAAVKFNILPALGRWKIVMNTCLIWKGVV